MHLNRSRRKSRPMSLLTIPKMAAQIAPVTPIDRRVAGAAVAGDSGASSGSNGDLPIDSEGEGEATYFPLDDPFASDGSVAESPEEVVDEDMPELATNTASNAAQEPDTHPPSNDGGEGGDLAEPLCDKNAGSDRG